MKKTWSIILKVIIAVAGAIAGVVLVYMPDTAFLPEPSLAPPFPVFFPGSFFIGLFCLILLRNQS